MKTPERKHRRYKSETSGIGSKMETIVLTPNIVPEKIELEQTPELPKGAHAETKHTRHTSDIPEEQPWNKRMRLLLKKIGERSMGYRWMHNQEVRYNNRRNYAYTLVNKLLLTIIGTLNAVEFMAFLSDSGAVNNPEIMISVVAIQLLLVLGSGIIVVIKESGNYELESVNHSKTVSKYNSINLDIQKQFSLPVHQRKNDVDFLDDIVKTYNDTMDNSPQIRQDTMDNYVKMTQDKGIYQPLSVGGVETIDINNDSVINVTFHQDETVKNTPKQLSNKTNNEYNYEMERWLKHF